jgi:hypothetical protein
VNIWVMAVLVHNSGSSMSLGCMLMAVRTHALAGELNR